MRPYRFLLLLLPLLLAGCGGATAADNPLVLGEPVTAEQLAQGQAIYEANCASCHGPEGQGEANWQQANADGSMPAPPHDESGHTWHHPDQQLLAIIAEGGRGPNSRMPAFGQQLTEEERKAVLGYLKSFWSPDIRQTQQEITERQP